MARKPRERKVPIINKEYIWELEVDGKLHEFKVFVGEEECITYADGEECKHLKIMDKRQIEGLLQIDCETRVLDEVTGFQLEAGIPYIRLEDDEGDRVWVMSDTTREDRLQDKVKRLKKEAYFYGGIGLVFLVMTIVELALGTKMENISIWPIMSIFFISGGALQIVRLKNELEAMGRPFSMKL